MSVIQFSRAVLSHRTTTLLPQILLRKLEIVDNICRNTKYPEGWMRGNLNDKFKDIVILILSGDTETYCFGKAEVRTELEVLGIFPKK